MNLNDKDHMFCQYYVSDTGVGFKKGEYHAGDTEYICDRIENIMIFIIKGKLKASFNEYKNKIFNQGEMLFIPKMSISEFTTLEDSKLIILSYETYRNPCDKKTVENLKVYTHDIIYDFVGLKIKKPLDTYLSQVEIYLNDGIKCSYFHEIMQLELFIIFKFYYTDHEKCSFFYHELGKYPGFRDIVMTNYKTVSSITKLAKLCNSSVTDFNRKFKEEFDDTPYNWMLKQKSRYVKAKLLDKNVPISNIVNEFNFSSPSHLNSFCRKFLGNTPMQIRIKQDKIE